MKNTDINLLVDNNVQLKEFKRRSKILHKQLKDDFVKQDDKFSLSYCQDLIVQQHGYKHWHEFHTQIKNSYLDTQGDVAIWSSNNHGIYRDNFFNFGKLETKGSELLIKQTQIYGHTLIIGSERKKLNSHLAKQAISQGQHLLFINCDTDTKNILEQHAFETGRQSDVVSISYSKPFLPKYFSWNANEISDIFMSLLGDHLDIKWRTQAALLMSALTQALVFMRDKEIIILDLEVIRDYLSLDNLRKLLTNKSISLPENIKQSIVNYFNFLPEFDFNSDKQSNSTEEEHGYIHMLFSIIISCLLPYTIQQSLNVKNQFEYSDFSGINTNKIILLQTVNFHNSVDDLSYPIKFLLNVIKIQSQYPNLKNTHSFKNYIVNDCPVSDRFSKQINNEIYSNEHYIFSYQNELFVGFSNKEIKNMLNGARIRINMSSDSDYKLSYKSENYQLHL